MFGNQHAIEETLRNCGRVIQRVIGRTAELRLHDRLVDVPVVDPHRLPDLDERVQKTPDHDAVVGRLWHSEHAGSRVDHDSIAGQVALVWYQGQNTVLNAAPAIVLFGQFREG